MPADQTERECLAAVAQRRPMDTDIFALSRAEQKGLVARAASGAGVAWSLTEAGAALLAEDAE